MSGFTLPDYTDRIIRHNKETWPRLANPTAWAERRADMREATPWFDSQEGGYQASRLPRPRGRPQYESDEYFTTGLFIGGYGSLNSYMDAETLIVSVNGTDSAVHTANQRYHSSNNAIRLRKLIGVIIGRGNLVDSRRKPVACRIFPCEPMPFNHDCWVLDWFLPVDIWPTISSQTKKVVWMVKYQKWKLSEQSWWANVAHGLPPSDADRDYSIKAKQEKCRSCKKSSKRIYADVFVCLQKDCPALWHVNGEVIADNKQYKYSDDYLKERYDPRNGCDFPADYPLLYPDFPRWYQREYLFPFGEPVTAQNFQAKMSVLMTGFCCPQCKMLNSRVRWNEWHCRNRLCGSYLTTGPGSAFQKTGHPPVMSLQALTDCTTYQSPDFRSLSHYQDTKETGLFTIHNFKLAEGCFAAVMRPKDGTQSIQQSDNFYQTVQSLANAGRLGLERRTIHTRGGVNGTAHFAANFGAAYHLVVNIGTEPWASAPPALVDARDQAIEWCKNYGPPGRPDFNELYLAGYFSNQKMGWHNDGESGLGEVIATWTLGGSGQFKFRILEKYKTGVYPASGNPIEEDPVVQGCDHYEERLRLKKMLDNKKITPAKWAEKFRKIVQNRARKTNNILLSFSVAHGDVVVMHGPNTQKHLEHCVDVDSPLRFALTFRHISDPFLGQANHQQRQNRLNERLAYDMAFDPKDDDDIASNSGHSNQTGPGTSGPGTAKRPRDDGDGDDTLDDDEKPLPKKLRTYPDTSTGDGDNGGDGHDDDGDEMNIDG